MKRPTSSSPLAPEPKGRCDSTDCCKLHHAHRDGRSQVAASFERIEPVQQTVSEVSYTGPACKVCVCSCYWLAGRTGKDSAQQQQESLWKAQRAVLRRAGARMRLHVNWRAPELNVYSRKRQRAGEWARATWATQAANGKRKRLSCSGVWRPRPGT